MTDGNKLPVQHSGIDDKEQFEFMLRRRTILKTAAVGAAGAFIGLGASSPVSAQPAGGPVVLMGIDAEDGGIGGHGPISVYVSVVNDILGNVSNGGTGIVVLGANGTNPRRFWDRIGTDTVESITYVTGASDIQTVDFSSYAMIGVVSSAPETTGGMTQSENNALVDRSADVAAFVNTGGGLLGFSQTDFTNAWDYVGSLGGFATVTNQFYSNIDPTTAGNDVGITDALDVTAWHDTFTDWPAFLDVLAWRSGYVDEQAAALGGASVVIQACEATETPLIASQTEDVGTVTVQQAEPGASLLVTYTTTGDWYMDETHLHIAADCADIPQTKKGNPKVGNFEFSETHHPAVQEYAVEVPFDPEWDSDALCIGAHAAVFEDTNGNGTFDSDYDREETAWGEGDRFTERGNWAMYFAYEPCDAE